MGLTKPIPVKLRGEMTQDQFYKKCCLCGATDLKIDYHHNLIYAGQRINEKWCILPVCKEHHEQARNSKIKEHLDYIMLKRATPEDLARYPRFDWVQKKKYLDTIIEKCKNCGKDMFYPRRKFCSDKCERQYQKKSVK